MIFRRWLLTVGKYIGLQYLDINQTRVKMCKMHRKIPQQPIIAQNVHIKGLSVCSLSQKLKIAVQQRPLRNEKWWSKDRASNWKENTILVSNWQFELLFFSNDAINSTLKWFKGLIAVSEMAWPLLQLTMIRRHYVHDPLWERTTLYTVYRRQRAHYCHQLEEVTE